MHCICCCYRTLCCGGRGCAVVVAVAAAAAWQPPQVWLPPPAWLPSLALSWLPRGTYGAGTAAVCSPRLSTRDCGHGCGPGAKLGRAAYLRYLGGRATEPSATGSCATSLGPAATADPRRPAWSYKGPPGARSSGRRWLERPGLAWSRVGRPAPAPSAVSGAEVTADDL